MVVVHQSVEHYSEQFAAKLRRKNYTTPKNYLDYISTYLSILERKDRENKNQVGLNEILFNLYPMIFHMKFFLK
jgi:hypothetical protein